MSIDDYLDLYNYAKQIGDAGWQAELIESLRKEAGTTESERRQKELQCRFEDINIVLKELFSKLENGEGDENQMLAWKERMIELKLERIFLARKMK